MSSVKLRPRYVFLYFTYALSYSHPKVSILSYIDFLLSNFCYISRFQLKCDKYWPDEAQDYGDISVMLVKSEHYSDYIIRTFNVKRVSRPSLCV